MSIILTAHQSGYLPWVGFFHKVALADKYINLDNVQYSKNDWVNRNRIKTSNGFIWLTVPVLTRDHMSKSISEMEINNQTRWRDKHWKSLQLHYGKTKYFNDYADFFEDLYKRDWQYLVDLNEYVLKWLIGTLGIKTELDDALNYDFTRSKNELLIDMCIKFDANMFIFGGEGRNYADIEAFEKAGIRPYFQEYKHPKYNQIHGEFVSHMSIVDLLFNEGPNSFEILMNGNDKKEDLL